MKALKVIGVTLIGLLVVLAGVGLVLPSSVRVERSKVIAAPQSTVFVLVNGFKRFNEWSPWHALDPQGTQYTYEGPPYGQGAKLLWTSKHPDVGTGSQLILESQPYSYVRSELDFGPDGNGFADFRLETVAAGTKVTWGMETRFGSSLVGRYFGLFFDSMIGSDYEKGLQGLKKLAESLPQEDWSRIDLKVVELQPMRVLVASGSADTPSMAGEPMQAAHDKVQAFLQQAKGLTQSGAPVTLVRAWGDKEYRFEAGVPVSGEATLAADAPVRLVQVPGGRALRAIYGGPRPGLVSVHAQMKAWLAVYAEKAGQPWEQYPEGTGTPQQEFLTHVYYPLQ
jgi:effector-binding domain-containing protein